MLKGPQNTPLYANVALWIVTQLMLEYYMIFSTVLPLVIRGSWLRHRSKVTNAALRCDLMRPRCDMSRQHSPTQPQSYTEIGFFAVALTFRKYKTLFTTHTGNKTDRGFLPELIFLLREREDNDNRQTLLTGLNAQKRPQRE
jgi:hypothetical protein